jgi:hypothetical protein
MAGIGRHANPFRNSSGSFAAIRRASSQVSNLAERLFGAYAGADMQYLPDLV